MTVIPVIVGSTRPGPFSEKQAEWILQHLKKRSGVDTRLLDLRDFPMPFLTSLCRRPRRVDLSSTSPLNTTTDPQPCSRTRSTACIQSGIARQRAS